MSMLPIDLSITLQRTTELARQPGETARPEMAQDQFAERFNREVRQNEQQVTQTNRAEENIVNRDGRGNSGGANLRQKKKNDEKKDKKPCTNTIGSGGSLLDISI